MVGLGELGLPNCEYLQNFVEVYGVDIDIAATNNAQARIDLPVFAKVSQVPQVDVFLICVGTKYNEELRTIDTYAVHDVAEQISKLNYRPTLVSIESTVPPGTTLAIHSMYLSEIHVSHVPHRFWKYDPEERGVRRQRNLAAVDSMSYDVAYQFYRKTIDMPVHTVFDLPAVEFGKIVENAYRNVRIAFVEEVWLACKKLGIDFDVLREASNTLTGNPPLMEARDGIGGACLPMAVSYLAGLGILPISISEAAKIVDAKYRLEKGV